jgi:hypothetical protein
VPKVGASSHPVRTVDHLLLHVGREEPVRAKEQALNASTGASRMLKRANQAEPTPARRSAIPAAGQAGERDGRIGVSTTVRTNRPFPKPGLCAGAGHGPT